MELSQEYFSVLAQTRVSHPHLASFLVTPFRIGCTQGEQRYAAWAFARRRKHVLFLAADTHQFGIAALEAPGGEGTSARQYPTLKLAALMFLGEAKNLDPD